MFDKHLTLQLADKLAKKLGYDDKQKAALQYELGKALPAILAKNPNALSHLLHHQEPKHDKISEQGLIGRILLYPTIVMPMCQGMTAEYFYVPEFRQIFGLCQSLSERNIAIDVDVVAAHLGTDTVDDFGGMQWLENLTMGAKDSDTAIELRDRVVTAHRSRTAWKACNEAIDGTYKKDLSETEAIISKLLESLQGGVQFRDNAKNGAELAELAELAFQANLQRVEDGIEYSGARMPIYEFNRHIGGWQDGELIVIAARPGMGKTATVVADIVESAFELNEEGLFFTLEMPAIQIILRLFFARYKVKKSEWTKALQSPELREKFSKFKEELVASKLVIDDTPGVTWQYMRNKALQVKNKNGGKLKRIWADYIQIMGSTDQGNREQQVSAITRNLKSLAKEVGCPVIALSQLSRAVETRGGMKRPQLSDLRESGGIEQDADLVVFLYRPEYYNIIEDEEGNSLKGVMELIIAKFRDGALDTIRCWYDAEYIRVANLSEKPDNYFNQNHKAMEAQQSNEEWFEMIARDGNVIEFDLK